MSAASENVPDSDIDRGPSPKEVAPMPARMVPGSILVLGVVTILISAWGGIVPYVGPTFGYSADGAGSWHWNLAHAVLALVPGAVGILAGLLMMPSGSKLRLGRTSLATSGLVAAAAGAWFTIGPFAWPVLISTRGYFVAGTPFRVLANMVGYSLGPGLILAAYGAFAMGSAIGHRRQTA
jgi:hypothetical protein